MTDWISDVQKFWMLSFKIDSDTNIYVSNKHGYVLLFPQLWSVVSFCLSFFPVPTLWLRLDMTKQFDIFSSQTLSSPKAGGGVAKDVGQTPFSQGSSSHECHNNNMVWSLKACCVASCALCVGRLWCFVWFSVSNIIPLTRAAETLTTANATWVLWPTFRISLGAHAWRGCQNIFESNNTEADGFLST